MALIEGKRRVFLSSLFSSSWEKASKPLYTDVGSYFKGCRLLTQSTTECVRRFNGCSLIYDLLLRRTFYTAPGILNLNWYTQSEKVDVVPLEVYLSCRRPATTCNEYRHGKGRISIKLVGAARAHKI